MSISKESAIRVLNAGANLKISGLSKESLIELANIAKARGLQLELKCSLSPDSMVEIASAGGKHVLFDVS
jgi:hypothetical protein